MLYMYIIFFYTYVIVCVCVCKKIIYEWGIKFHVILKMKKP